MSITLHGVAAGKSPWTRPFSGIDQVPQYDLNSDELTAEISRFEAAIKVTRRQLEQNPAAPYPKTRLPNWARLSHYT